MDLGRVANHTPRRVTDEPREAGVLVPIVERPDGEAILFAQRADDLDQHPGEMSFPGGGREPEDADIEATALREANEEVGLRPDEAEVVGRLDDIRTISEYAVTPVVARVPDREYRPDGYEVIEAALLPVTGLMDPDNYEFEHREHPHYGEIVLHYFHVNGFTVWGATGRIVVQLLELTTDWRVPDGAREA